MWNEEKKTHLNWDGGSNYLLCPKKTTNCYSWKYKDSLIIMYKYLDCFIGTEEELLLLIIYRSS